jgi:hypothetical protein
MEAEVALLSRNIVIQGGDAVPPAPPGSGRWANRVSGFASLHQVCPGASPVRSVYVYIPGVRVPPSYALLS